MKKLFKPLAKTTTLVAAFAALITGVSASAWGPERQTYTNEDPAKYATFNSITNNAAIGDERNFVRVGAVGSTDPYTDEIEIVPGKEYEVYIYYHNDASESTNASGYGIATLTRAASTYPTVVKSGEKGTVTGTITWNYVDLNDQTHDGKVWDEAYFTTSAESVNLRYKTGSATIHNSGAANGSILSTALFTEQGTLIGYNQLGGVLPGCAQYSGYITYTLIAEDISSTLEKQVSLDGETWSSEVTADPGAYVTYKVKFQNTGNINLTNVIFKDVHDDGLTLRPETTKLFDYQNVEGKLLDDILDLSGYNVGDVVPGALVELVYQARISSDITSCTNLNNTISVAYNGVDQRTSSTLVKVSCAPGETPKEDLPKEIVSTGPLEITIAVVIILGIAGGSFYLIRTRRALKTVEKNILNHTSEPENHTQPNNRGEENHTSDSENHTKD